MRFIPFSFIVMLCFLNSFLVSAQQPEYYANGQIKAEGKYKKNEKTGDWTYYYEDGTISIKESYDRRYPNIKMATYFYANGKTKATGKLINNTKYEDWIWYREDGTLEFKGNYTNDRLNGALTYYNKNGIIEKKGGFKDKLMHGDWEFYYFDGILMKKGSYKEGKEIGEWENYDRTGTYESTTVYPYEYDDIQFYDSQKTSYSLPKSYTKQPFKKTYSNGNTEVEGQVNNGYKVEAWKWYYENGTLKEEGSFGDYNSPTGIWKTYYPNGVLRSEEKRDKGHSFNLVMFHPSGKPKHKNTESTKYTTYYETGEVYSIETKILGVTTGKDYYNKNGKYIKSDPYKFK
jgi:uncharacterized protein